ncbi:DUF5916 domain-containing protein [Archangium gephyra]|uniref:DUF5916 domain-containing protein n=1 Tax=Archangium gephyra TaxID=48 RepID=UPI003B80AD67
MFAVEQWVSRWVAALGLLLLPGQVLAEGLPSPAFETRRIAEPPRIDGVLDDAAWVSAPPFSAFEQSYPQPLAPPSERTEVRLTYDDQNLYIAVTCFDREPSAIIASLGRRDGIPSSDVVRVMIDSLGDRRTGYMFSINAGGTLEDARITGDTEILTDWDGAWEGAAAVTAEGWVAELRLPLKLLRFPDVEEQLWGFHVRRTIARSHEQLDSVSIPRDANALVSRFRRLGGMRGLRPRRQLTLTPYVAGRFSRSPLFEDASRPRPRISSPSLDVGLDVHATLASDLSLAGTLNPDFGQVEADQLTTNFSNAELFFPEKRPFFLEGLELFSPVDGDAQQTLVYSRRMGLEVPMLGALRLTGTVKRGLEVGLLSAVVAGAQAPPHPLAGDGDPERLPPDGRFQFHPLRPFHLGPNHSLPREVAPPTHFFAGVARMQPAEGSTLGLILTSVNPLQSGCAPGSGETCAPPRAGQAAAMDFSLRNDSGEYTLVGQVDASRVTGGPREGALLEDGTLLRPGDLGFGAFVRGGKIGGEPWRLDISYGYTSPRLDLNPAGYQPFQNEQTLTVHPKYFRTKWGSLLSVELGAKAVGRWSTDSRRMGLEQRYSLTANLVSPGFHTFGCQAGGSLRRRDLREISQSGVAFERPTYYFVDCQVETNPSRPLSGLIWAYVDVNTGPRVRLGPVGQSYGVDATWRPLPRLETQLGVHWEAFLDGPRWVESLDNGQHLFGEFAPRFLTLSLRQLVVLGPTLTFQAYAQMLSGYGLYGALYQASAGTDGEITFADLERVEGEGPSFHTTALNLNLVLRWEYAMGSTLFLVYSRAQEELPDRGPGLLGRLTPLPRGLLEGPRRESFLVKASFAW